MNNTDLVLEALRRAGQLIARDLQDRSAGMTGTELNGEADFFPSFAGACAKENMLKRQAGFICRSAAGRVVKLLQPYDSTIYTGQPEDLPAQWGFVWSKDPARALPFIALSTSPYQTGDVCTYGGHVWASGQDGNVWAPGTVNVSWTDLGEAP